MNTQATIKMKLEKVFDERQATVLAEVIDDAYNALVKTSDFNELKSIVKDIEITLSELAQEQKTTRKELNELAVALKELAAAQKKTEEELSYLTKEDKKRGWRIVNDCRLCS